MYAFNLLPNNGYSSSVSHDAYCDFAVGASNKFVAPTSIVLRLLYHLSYKAIGV